ncbi:unnamed protein product [Blepharisma stoltei]|uniref:Uncharacterized protein n=1 Tax=Blepharisma stoltei TaxID=1481888 RepID=A0AAU9IHK9_9CILI|nr:unnamed protein product [Blepharisma stoltei]
MDAFLGEISDKLRTEIEAISTEVEPELKQVIVRSYTCMADCYKSPDPLSHCGNCADRCNLLVKEPQEELEKHIHYVQNTFQNCMQGCGLKINKSDNQEIKTCIFNCSNDAFKLLGDVKKSAKEIIRKYLD